MSGENDDSQKIGPVDTVNSGELGAVDVGSNGTREAEKQTPSVCPSKTVSTDESSAVHGLVNKLIEETKRLTLKVESLEDANTKLLEVVTGYLEKNLRIQETQSEPTKHVRPSTGVGVHREGNLAQESLTLNSLTNEVRETTESLPTLKSISVAIISSDDDVVDKDMSVSFVPKASRKLASRQSLKTKTMKKNTIWAEADPGEMQLALKLATASSRCEQLATASSLTRNCELGQFKLLIYGVAAFHWSREATRICE